MAWLRNFLAATERALLTSAVLLLGINLIAVSTQIIMRYIVNNPTSWSDPVASDSLAWMTFLGATAAIRSDQNLRIRFIRDKFPMPIRRVVDIVCHLVTLGFSLALLNSGVHLMVATKGTQVAGIPLPLSFADLYSVTVVSAAIMALFTLEQVASITMDWKR